MTKEAREAIERQIAEIWALVGDLEAVSMRLRQAADAAMESMSGPTDPPEMGSHR
jgi:hypothetical protein